MKPFAIQSVSALHRLLELPPPKHPLISLIDFEQIKCYDDAKLEAVTYDFYCIAIKKNFNDSIRYGQRHYDFNEGVMTFYSPRQVIVTEIRDDWDLKGFWLVVHPDFLQGFPLISEIQRYSYFSYLKNEALHLSDEEKTFVNRLFEDIRKEYQSPVDRFSQQVIIKLLELLLSYSDRFYHRQFLTRKQGGDNLLSAFDEMLESYFQKGEAVSKGVPGVGYFSDKLNVSKNYLSDMLRNLSGQSAQQHIQAKLIEKGKEMLGSSRMNVSEIAYQLGFAFPQSFNKFFKRETNQTPLEFRQYVNPFHQPQRSSHKDR